MFTTKEQQVADIVPVAGKRVPSDLNNGKQTHSVEMRFTGTATIAGGAATRINNRGSILACFDEIGILENGKAKTYADGPVIRALCEAAASSPLSYSRVSGTAAAAYPLDETIRLQFAHPIALEPRETAYVEKDVRQTLQAYVKLAADGGGSELAVVPGGVTITLTNLNVTVRQIYEDAEGQLAPYFIPILEQFDETVVGTQAKLIHFLKTDDSLRALVVSPVDTVIGEVEDVINYVTLRGAKQVWVDHAGWKDLVAGSEFDFGGASTFNVGGAHLVFNFQTFGRLSRVLNPVQDTNLRFEFDCQASAVGTGTTKIKVTRVALTTPAGLVRPLTIPA